jgi:uncharacterized coiled-coil protein SlyX
MPTEEQPAHGKASATSRDVTLQALERRLVEQDAEIAQLRSALAQSESRVAELHARNATAGRLELSEPEPEPEPEPASVPRLIQGGSAEEEGIPPCSDNGAAAGMPVTLPASPAREYLTRMADSPAQRFQNHAAEAAWLGSSQLRVGQHESETETTLVSRSRQRVPPPEVDWFNAQPSELSPRQMAAIDVTMIDTM